jgi:protein phosphatase 1 regulatory subunit 7
MSFPNVGFRGRETVLWVDSRRIKESMTAAKLLGVTYIGVSPKHGYDLPGLSFLKDYPNVERLVLPFAADYDLAPLSNLTQLRHLTISESRQPLDLEWFPFLEELQTDWHTRIQWNSIQRLRDLYLRGYSPRAGDLSALPHAPTVARLELNQGKVRSLAGVERFPRVCRLEFYHLKQLQSIGDLCTPKPRITFLQVDNCRSIEDIEAISCLKSLEVLRLNDCGRLTSLRFLEAMPRLREFRFVGTVIEDGDLTPLLRLETVAFLPRSGYSHHPDEIDALLRQRSQTEPAKQT